MNFQYPAFLLALPPLILLAFVYRRRRRSSAERKRFPVFVASVCFIILALAKPYWQSVPAKERVKGVDLVLVTDVSQSMFCDVRGKISRIDLARKFIRGLLPSFRGSQVALIYFAGDAQIGSPFTSDLPALSMMIDSIAPAMSAQPGTRTDSLEEALNTLLKTRPAGKLPLILLFSDGEFFDSTRGFQSYLKRKNFRIFTYLCGNQKAPVLNYNLNAPVQDAFSTPNANTLMRLAETGQGSFFDLTNERTDTIFKEVSNRIDDLIVAGQSVPDYRPIPFLVVALLLLFIYQWVPTGQTNLVPGHVLAICFLCISLSMKPDESRKIFQDALDAFRQGKHQEALEKLKTLPEDFFPAQKNIVVGNIYYSGQKYDEAIQSYRKALELDPFNAIARWNWEVALKRRSNPTGQQPQPEQDPAPQNKPEDRNALLQYADQLEKEQRQKSNRANIGKSEFAW